ncbi:GAF domain-containing protein [bacterium]|nr:MAG: GAF domain-containing protein [bacterium]
MFRLIPPFLLAPADSEGASGDGLPPDDSQEVNEDETSPAKKPVQPSSDEFLSEEHPGSHARPTTREGTGLPSAAELEQTLQRLMRRVSMLVQAEKCVFLLHDRERDELVARPPAVGFSREQLRTLRLSRQEGVAARAFSYGEPVVVDSTASLSGFDQAWARRIDVRNLIAYPLVLERRDDTERVADRLTVGVFLVLNKRGRSPFSPEDLRLLSVMARQVTAVIADAQVYLQLTEEKEQLQATLLSLGSGVLMVESTGHISLLNPAARAILNLPDDEGDGLHFEDCIKNEGIVQLLRDTTQNGRETGTEIEVLLPGNNEPRIFQAQTAFVRGEKAGVPAILGVVVIFNDITEIRNVERMKTAFVSTVSHELRTPLTSIKGFISTLLQDTDNYFDQETRTEFYTIIDNECDRLRRLIDDLLNVSRIESGRALQMNWSYFDPLAAIEKVLHAQSSYTDKHQLVMDYHGEPINLLGDADKFDQILTNLLSNAIKYSPTGGEVRVIVKVDQHDISIGVRDQGMGIAPDKLGKVFEKFERVDNRDTRQAGGTGIGLFLVQHLVERHEGTIDVKSELGTGSTFTVHLPLRPKEAVDEMESGIREK